MKKTILLIFSVLISASSTDGMAYTFVHIGDSYPTFCTKQFKGDRFCSINYDGNLLVISFFNLDYIASHHTLRDLQNIRAKYSESNVSIIGILSGEANLKSLEALITEKAVSLPILLDPDRQIYHSFGVFVYPSTGIFGPNKRLKYYLPSNRLNYKKHLEGYIRFLLGKISETELENIIHPPPDELDSNFRKAKY